jgi:hypothetical protein
MQNSGLSLFRADKAESRQKLLPACIVLDLRQAVHFSLFVASVYGFWMETIGLKC